MFLSDDICLRVGFGVSLAIMLLILSVIDARTYRLPDRFTWSLGVLGLLQAAVLKGAFGQALINAMAGYGLFVAIAYGFRRVRGLDGLGRGDAKLLAAGGAWCGAWWGSVTLPALVLLASLSGLAYAFYRKHQAHMPLPFGPFLALAIFSFWVGSLMI